MYFRFLTGIIMSVLTAHNQQINNFSYVCQLKSLRAKYLYKACFKIDAEH